MNQEIRPTGLYCSIPNEREAELRQIFAHGFNFQREHNTTPSARDIYQMESGILIKDPHSGPVRRAMPWALEMPSARDVRAPAARAQKSGKKC